MASKKQYGLIIPQKTVKSKIIAAKPSVFENDSSSDEEESRRKEFSSSLHREGVKKMQSKANQVAIAEALEEDPTVFMYDEVYDEMQEKKKKSIQKLQEKKENKSRYIANLKRTSELRKIEQELAYERRVQKERETEGDEFRDKEAFVTGAYKKRLQERAAIEKKLKEEEEIEKHYDVTKQNDMGMMYRHLLNQKTTTVDKEQSDSKHSSSVSASQEHDQPDVKQQEGLVQQEDLVEESEPVSQGDKEEEEMQVQDEEETTVSQQPEHKATIDDDQCQTESKEERRKRLFAKRTSNDVALSAKERYLARKRAKISKPTIANDDDD